ncbi:hypothetical protein CLOM_g1934, partial [Closterium sp. NIES-68]
LREGRDWSERERRFAGGSRGREQGDEPRTARGNAVKAPRPVEGDYRRSNYRVVERGQEDDGWGAGGGYDGRERRDGGRGREEGDGSGFGDRKGLSDGDGKETLRYREDRYTYESKEREGYGRGRGGRGYGRGRATGYDEARGENERGATYGGEKERYPRGSERDASGSERYQGSRERYSGYGRENGSREGGDGETEYRTRGGQRSDESVRGGADMGREEEMS